MKKTSKLLLAAGIGICTMSACSSASSSSEQSPAAESEVIQNDITINVNESEASAEVSTEDSQVQEPSETNAAADYSEQTESVSFEDTPQDVATDELYSLMDEVKNDVDLEGSAGENLETAKLGYELLVWGSSELLTADEVKEEADYWMNLQSSDLSEYPAKMAAVLDSAMELISENGAELAETAGKDPAAIASIDAIPPMVDALMEAVGVRY